MPSPLFRSMAIRPRFAFPVGRSARSGCRRWRRRPICRRRRLSFPWTGRGPCGHGWPRWRCAAMPERPRARTCSGRRGRLGPESPALFDTRQSGRLVCRRGEAGWIRMDFPASPVEPVPVPAGLERALGAEVVWVGRSAYDYLVRVTDESCLRGIRPDSSALAAFPVRGVIVTAALASWAGGFDFVSRFFAPGVGAPEDPVTGSAHCALAPYGGPSWKDGDARMAGKRARRRSADAMAGRPRRGLSGQAVTVSSGTLIAGCARSWSRAGMQHRRPWPMTTPRMRRGRGEAVIGRAPDRTRRHRRCSVEIVAGAVTIRRCLQLRRSEERCTTSPTGSSGQLEGELHLR